MSSHVFSSLQDTCDFLHYLQDGKIEISLPKGSFQQIENEIKSKAEAVNFIDSIYSA